MILLNEEELTWDTLKSIGLDLGFGHPQKDNPVEQGQYIEKLLGELRIRKEDIPNLICLLERIKNGGEEPEAWGKLGRFCEGEKLELEKLFSGLTKIFM